MSSHLIQVPFCGVASRSGKPVVVVVRIGFYPDPAPGSPPPSPTFSLASYSFPPYTQQVYLTIEQQVRLAMFLPYAKRFISSENMYLILDHSVTGMDILNTAVSTGVLLSFYLFDVPPRQFLLNKNLFRIRFSQIYFARL